MPLGRFLKLRLLASGYVSNLSSIIRAIVVCCFWPRYPWQVVQKCSQHISNQSNAAYLNHHKRPSMGNEKNAVKHHVTNHTPSSEIIQGCVQVIQLRRSMTDGCWWTMETQCFSLLWDSSKFHVSPFSSSPGTTWAPHGHRASSSLPLWFNIQGFVGCWMSDNHEISTPLLVSTPWNTQYQSIQSHESWSIMIFRKIKPQRYWKLLSSQTF